MASRYRLLAALGLGLSLTACSTVQGWFDIDDEDDPTQPAELQDVEPSIKIDKLWSESIGNGQGKGQG